MTMAVSATVACAPSSLRRLFSATFHKRYEEAAPTTGSIVTAANAVTLLRLLLIVPGAAAVLSHRDRVVLGLVALFFVLDEVDGNLARWLGQETRFGAAFDRVVDAAATLTGFVCFAITGQLPMWLLALALLKQAAQLVTGAILASRGLRYPPVYLVPGYFGFGAITAATLLAAALAPQPLAKLVLVLSTAALLLGSVAVFTSRSRALLRR